MMRLSSLLLATALVALPRSASGQAGGSLSQAHQDSVAKRRTLPPLALPDIVIFGRSTATVREGSKLFPAGKRTALDREVGAPVGEKGGSRTGWGGGRMLAAQERTGPGRWVRAYLRGGTFGELIAGGDAWFDVQNWKLLANLVAEGTGGHLPNSSSFGGRGRVSAIRYLGPTTVLRMGTGYGAGRGEEWGVGAPSAVTPIPPGVPSGAVRTWFNADYSMELEGMIRRGVSVHGGVGGRKTGFNDDVRGSDLQPRSQGGWIEAGLEWLTGRTIMDLTARNEGDRVSGPQPTQRANLSSVRLTVRSLIGETSNILAGAVWYQVDAGLGLVTRIWPLAEFTSQYSERFSMYVRYRPQIDYMTLGAAREQNPFVANSYSVVPREERFHFCIGLRYIVALHLTMEFQVARRQFDRLPLWRLVTESDPWSDGLFKLDGVGPVGVNSTRLSLEGTPGDKLALNGEMVLRDPSGGGLAELPHVPRLQFSGGIDGRGPWGLELGVRVTHLGERFGAGEEVSLASRRMSPATDLGIRISRGFGLSLTAWLELRNVLDEEITLWEGYPLPGRTSAVGLSIRF
ncbi:MAG: TonB-dependent receptor [Candidatus Latescibacteria bacterium]|nr:TonB-dependent receptor [Candidatus Latescibacterota bacterium]